MRGGARLKSQPSEGRGRKDHKLEGSVAWAIEWELAPHKLNYFALWVWIKVYLVMSIQRQIFQLESLPLRKCRFCSSIDFCFVSTEHVHFLHFVVRLQLRVQLCGLGVVLLVLGCMCDELWCHRLWSEDLSSEEVSRDLLTFQVLAWAPYARDVSSTCS